MSVTDAVLAAVESLSPAQQQEVLAFAQALKQSSEATEVSNRWLESPFVGIWKDREDMQNSVEWVRQMRQQHWYRA
jgi:tRNA A-37 threonylcarbamoyl transferase component Bud32